eukprot:COSAG01_NODE_12449_length_1736_cov_63.159438_2_plen_175_part_00
MLAEALAEEARIQHEEELEKRCAEAVEMGLAQEVSAITGTSADAVQGGGGGEHADDVGGVDGQPQLGNDAQVDAQVAASPDGAEGGGGQPLLSNRLRQLVRQTETELASVEVRWKEKLSDQAPRAAVPVVLDPPSPSNVGRPAQAKPPPAPAPAPVRPKWRLAESPWLQFTCGS